MKHEKNYSATNLELLAIKFGFEKFRYYLQGAHTTVVTDHKPLVTLIEKFNTETRYEPKVERWLTYLSQFDYNIIYESGENNPADLLSRQPITVSDITNNQILLSSSILVNKSNSIIDTQKQMTNDEKQLLSKDKKITIKDNIYYYRDKLYVPKASRQDILSSAHGHLLSGHYGVSKTHNKL